MIADIPVVAAAAAQRLGLCADEARVHDLGQKMVGLAEIGQKIRVAVRLRVLGDGAADQADGETLRFAGIDLYAPAVRPFAAREVLFVLFIVPHIDPFEQPVRPFLPVPVDEPAEEVHPFGVLPLDREQRFAVQPVAARLVEHHDRGPIEHIARHHVFAEVGQILHQLKILAFGFFADLLGLVRVMCAAVALARLGVSGDGISAFHPVFLLADGRHHFLPTGMAGLPGGTAVKTACTATPPRRRRGCTARNAKGAPFCCSRTGAGRARPSLPDKSGGRSRSGRAGTDRKRRCRRSPAHTA